MIGSRANTLHPQRITVLMSLLQRLKPDTHARASKGRAVELKAGLMDLVHGGKQCHVTKGLRQQLA